MAGPKTGDPAPDFELHGTGGRTVKLSELRGKPVVLAFYPGDFTPTCTRQFCSYRDAGDTLGGLDAEVLGISPQSVESHEKFTTKHELTVPLLADQDKAVAKAYGVLNPLGQVKRSIFVIDREGIVRHRKVSALVGLTYESADDIAEILRSLPGGPATPA